MSKGIPSHPLPPREPEQVSCSPALRIDPAMNSPSWPQLPHLSSPVLLPEWAQKSGVREAGSCRPDSTSPFLKGTQTRSVQSKMSNRSSSHTKGTPFPRKTTGQEHILTVCHMALLSVTKNSSASSASSVCNCCFPCSRQCFLYKASIALGGENNC